MKIPAMTLSQMNARKATRECPRLPRARRHSHSEAAKTRATAPTVYP